MAYKRKIKNWLKGFQFWMQESEAPESYIVWGAISALAGVTMRKVYTKWVYHDFYTNMYIIFVGPPGITHKSSVISQVRKVLFETGVPTTSESITREGLIKQMKERGTEISSAITALPDEFSDFIRPSGHTMVEFLTSIYGAQSRWEYTTAGRGVEVIENAFVNLLAGTTPKWIGDEFDIHFVEQGFASRSIFIFEQEPRFRKARAKITDEMRRMWDYLVEDLIHIKELQGEFIWTKETEDWFDAWYEKELYDEYKQSDYRLKGYMARKPTHLLKLAMVLSLAETDELILDIKYIQWAREFLDSLSASMSKTFSAVGRNEYASDLERIFHDIEMEGGMTQSAIIRKNFHAMRQEVLYETLNTLVLMGYVTREKQGNDIFYVPIKRGPK